MQSLADPETSRSAAEADATTVLFMLHFLGGSTRTWDAVARRLRARLDCRGIDLPGFGDAAPQGARTVREMADHVAAIIRDAAPRRWMVAGHSMGAKVALAVARRAEDGAPGLGGLAGIVFVAGSPPAPEPMDEERRRTMLAWFDGDAAAARRDADGFIRQSVGAPLDAATHAGAVDDVLRMSRAAWRGWLERGSREDWSAAVGTLRSPALLLSGEKDADLGPAAQSRLVVPHFTDARALTLAGAGHLLPLERPAEVAAAILAFASPGGGAPGDGVALDPATRALIGSDRVSARTRDVLLDRARPDDPDRAPAALPPDLFATLGAVVARIVPEPGFDLAARIDERLAAGGGDGWRFADLPPDAEAYRLALAALDARAHAAQGSPFTALGADRQDDLLRGLGEEGGAEDPPPTPDRLTPAQMKHWFEDLRAEATRTYMAHPATLARIGYGGFANGGDGPRKQGFALVGAGEREPWEPVGLVEARR